MIADFVIFGSPARKSNGRIISEHGLLLGKSAQAYINIFKKQIVRIKNKFRFPIDERNALWVFEIYYNNKSADASIELVFDLFQYHGVVTNDVSIRNYLVLSEEYDYEVPRIVVSIYK